MDPLGRGCGHGFSECIARYVPLKAKTLFAPYLLDSDAGSGIAGDLFLIQQDNASTYRAHDKFLCRTTLQSSILKYGQPTVLI